MRVQVSLGIDEAVEMFRLGKCTCVCALHVILCLPLLAGTTSQQAVPHSFAIHLLQSLLLCHFSIMQTVRLVHTIEIRDP